MMNTPRARDGKYSKHPACDGCGKPALDYCTDDEVCGGTDDPGFVVCERRACLKLRDGLDVEARRALYTAQRAENRAAEAEGRNPVVVAAKAPDTFRGGADAAAMHVAGALYIPAELRTRLMNELLALKR